MCGDFEKVGLGALCETDLHAPKRFQTASISSSVANSQRSAWASPSSIAAHSSSSGVVDLAVSSFHQNQSLGGQLLLFRRPREHAGEN
jgi:hypothetical protein